MRRLWIVVAIALAVWQFESRREGATSPWDEVSAADFDSRVLQSPIPALVIFDTSVNCHGATPVFVRLRRRWKADLAVFHLNVAENQEFAERYGVRGSVVLALFENGEKVRMTDASTLIQPLLGPGDSVESLEVFYDGYLGALEGFAELR